MSSQVGESDMVALYLLRVLMVFGVVEIVSLFSVQQYSRNASLRSPLSSAGLHCSSWFVSLFGFHST